MSEVNRIEIPFVVDTLTEGPEEDGKLFSTPVVGASVSIKYRDSEASVVVSAVEGEESPIVPTTDENGRINGWVEEGAYIITVSAGKPYIAAQKMAWDALSGRGIENKSVGGESVYKDDLKKDENANDKASILEFLLPTGTSLDFRGESAPAGFLLEDGSSYSTATYNRLFKVIGYKYGGSGGNFNVPDSRGRANIGAGAGPGLTNRVFATTGGTETVTLTTAQIEAHTHGQVSVGGSASVSGSVSGGMGGTIADHNHWPPGNLNGRSYLNHAEENDETASKHFLSKDSAGEVQVLWGNGGWGETTGGITGTVGCSVEGTLSGSMGGSIVTNSATTTSTGGNEAHANMSPWLAVTRIIKT